MSCGDRVVLALGCQAPFILRSQDSTEDGRPVHRLFEGIPMHGYKNDEAIQERGRLAPNTILHRLSPSLCFAGSRDPKT